MAARIRTSTGRLFELPTGVTSPSCSTRSSFACMTTLMSPISSRKSVPPLAASKVPAPVGDGAGERPLHVAEHLALDQLGRHRGAVQLHERPLAARRERVDRAGDQLLARAPLAGDEHPGPRRAPPCRRAGRRAASLPSGRPCRSAPRPSAPPGPPRPLRAAGGEDAREHLVQPLAGERLLDVLRGAEPHRLDRVGHAAVARDHDDRGDRRAPLQLLAGRRGRCRPAASGRGAPPPGSARRTRAAPRRPTRPEAAVAAGGEHVEADLAKGAVVVDDQDQRTVGIHHGKRAGCYHPLEAGGKAEDARTAGKVQPMRLADDGSPRRSSRSGPLSCFDFQPDVQEGPTPLPAGASRPSASSTASRRPARTPARRAINLVVFFGSWMRPGPGDLPAGRRGLARVDRRPPRTCRSTGRRTTSRTTCGCSTRTS